MRTYTLNGAKNYGFFEIYGVSARTKRGWASAEILWTRVERSICRDAPKLNNFCKV